jgi:hypothetical protein
MRKSISPAFKLVLAALFFQMVLVTPASFAQSRKFSSIEYQGSRIQLDKAYADFDEYKDDRTNLGTKQADQADLLLRTAKFGPLFANSQVLGSALAEIQFPGYGLFYANQLGARTAVNLELAYVEIPMKNRNRYFVLERTHSSCFKVLMDFVANASPEITRVGRAASGELEFRTSDGRVVMLKPE